MSALAIITARGGSKRIPRKNIRLFLGRPIIAYSIEAALQSALFDEVMVSTDDEEIAEIAREHGALVPFMRSAAASDDHSTTAQVLAEVLGDYRERGRAFDLACGLYPTAPFVTPARLRDAFARLEQSGADCVLPVTRFDFPIWRALGVEGDRLAFVWPENAERRSQDLPEAFHDAGQFYLFRTAPFLANPQLPGPNAAPLLVDRATVQDIDSEEDWQLAELKYRLMAESQ